LIAACERAGVRFHPHAEAGEWRGSAGGRIESLEFRDGRRLAAGRYLIAAGAWSGSLVAGEPPIVHPVRGQIVLLQTGRPDTMPILMHGKRYIVSRHDGRVLVGSTEEPEAGFTKGNTPAAVMDLLSFAVRLQPALAKAEIETCWSGLRPGTADGLPFIGPVPGLANVWIASGHFRSGVQLSIGTARLIRELLTGAPTSVSVDSFRVDRPPLPPRAAAFRC
jgi:glycine oxidase